jgi:hypothetical protein
MDGTSRQSLILSLLRGLLGEVHPELRQASIETDGDAHIVRVRFEYDGDAHGPAQESCSCAAGEVIGDFPAPWGLDEQHVAAPLPRALSPLRYVVYRRWEHEGAAAAYIQAELASRVKNSG